MTMEPAKALLEGIVSSIARNPFTIEDRVDEMGVLLTLSPHKDDMGVIIGRSGATAKAIRTLLRVAGMQQNARVNLKINEPEGGKFTHETRDKDLLN